MGEDLLMILEDLLMILEDLLMKLEDLLMILEDLLMIENIIERNEIEIINSSSRLVEAPNQIS
jgi:hypothetical protein